MRRRVDRGEGPVSHLAVILLVAIVAAAITVVALPDQVTGSIQAAVCRVFGQECGDQRPSANPSANPSASTTPGQGPTSPGTGPTSGPGTNPTPGPNTNPTGLSPEEQEYQNALNAFNTANSDATAAENEWNAFNLLNELAKLGMDFLFGDIIACIEKPNIGDCLWALVGIIPWGKLGKFLKMIPDLIRLADRFLDLKRRLDKARQARNGARKRLDDAITACTRRPAPANSFVPGTGVLMADGTRRPIEQIRTGDLVWAADPATGQAGPRRVSTLITGSGVKQLVDLTLDPDGVPGGRTTSLTATAGHPFWEATTRQWVDAAELAAGDRLATPAGGAALVLGTRARTARDQRVHNLTVAGLHTFYVVAGGQALLVHNANAACMDPELDDEGLSYVRGKHFPDGAEADPSKGLFNRDLADDDLHDIVERSKSTDPVGPNADGHFERKVNMEKVIGNESQQSGGLPTTCVMVVQDKYGAVRTMYPVRC